MIPCGSCWRPDLGIALHQVGGAENLIKHVLLNFASELTLGTLRVVGWSYGLAEKGKKPQRHTCAAEPGERVWGV